MNRIFEPALVTSAAIAALLGAALAQADTGTPSYDLRATCPGVDAALQDALAGAWARHGETGTMQVTMHLEGDRIQQVETRGLRTYAPAVRRAVGDLACSSGEAESKTVVFSVNFKAEPEAD